MGFKCSKDDPKSDCGCDGKTIQVIENIEGTVDFPPPASILRIFIGQNDAVVPCHLPDSIRNLLAIDKLKVKLSGDRKMNCPNWRAAGDPIILTKLEVLSKGD